MVEQAGEEFPLGHAEGLEERRAGDVQYGRDVVCRPGPRPFEVALVDRGFQTLSLFFCEILERAQLIRTVLASIFVAESPSRYSQTAINRLMACPSVSHARHVLTS